MGGKIPTNSYVHLISQYIFKISEIVCSLSTKQHNCDQMNTQKEKCINMLLYYIFCFSFFGENKTYC